MLGELIGWSLILTVVALRIIGRILHYVIIGIAAVVGFIGGLVGVAAYGLGFVAWIGYEQLSRPYLFLHEHLHLGVARSLGYDASLSVSRKSGTFEAYETRVDGNLSPAEAALVSFAPLILAPVAVAGFAATRFILLSLPHPANLAAAAPLAVVAISIARYSLPSRADAGSVVHAVSRSPWSLATPIVIPIAFAVYVLDAPSAIDIRYSLVSDLLWTFLLALVSLWVPVPVVAPAF